MNGPATAAPTSSGSPSTASWSTRPRAPASTILRSPPPRALSWTCGAATAARTSSGACPSRSPSASRLLGGGGVQRQRSVTPAAARRPWPWLPAAAGAAARGGDGAPAGRVVGVGADRLEGRRVGGHQLDLRGGPHGFHVPL